MPIGTASKHSQPRLESSEVRPQLRQLLLRNDDLPMKPSHGCELVPQMGTRPLPPRFLRWTQHPSVVRVNLFRSGR